MNAATLDLQETLFRAFTTHSELTAVLGAAKIYDQPRAGLDYPYITFGKTSSYDWSTSTETGAEVLMTIHSWSKYRGRKQVLHIMDLIGKRLDEGAINLKHHALISLQLESSEIRYDEDHDVYEGTMHIRALVELI